MAKSKDNYKLLCLAGLILVLTILSILGFGKDKSSREQKVQNDTISLVVDTTHADSTEVIDSVVDAVAVDTVSSLDGE